MLLTAGQPQPVDTARDLGTPAVLARAVPVLPCDPLVVVEALASLAGQRRLVALTGSWAGGATIISADPRRVVEAHDPPTAAASIEALDHVEGAQSPTAPTAVGGGWIGLIGHAAGAGLDTLTRAPRPVRGPVLPMLAFGWYDHLLRFDGTQWWAEGLGKRGLAAALRLAAEAAARVGARAAQSTASGLTLPDPTAHMIAVERAVTAIRTGEMVQTTICSRYQFHVKHPVTAWTRLVEALQPDYAALVTGPWGALLGASPELFLRRHGREIESAPIKGTAPASHDPDRLRRSAKDIAENLMIVDLVRNDLSRVCVPGTVATPGLLTVTPQSGVNHLVSRVTGLLRPGTGDAELLRATFPPGSVTGAPKLRATEVSNELESTGRGAHTGAVGLITAATGLEMAVTIRSVEVGPDGDAALGIGSGITVASSPSSEWSECIVKATPVLAALGMTLDPPILGTASRKRLADPRQGLIETMLVVDGNPIELADHLARLQRSFAEVYGRSLRGDPARDVHRATPAAGVHRLRLHVVPTSDQHRDHIAADKVVPWRRPDLPAERPGRHVFTALAPPNGDERHKYADRSVWDDLEAGLPGGAAATARLVVTDTAGHLLEGSRSNVFAVIDGQLVTPPADGRILPGTARQQLIDEAEAAGWRVTLASLGPADVWRAEGLFLLNALRGVEWVADLDWAGRLVRWERPHPCISRAARLVLARWLRNKLS